MPRQAIQQATCTDCGESDDNHTVTNSDIISGDDEDTRIEYSTRCECCTTGTVTIDEEGVSATDEISHEDASWNDDSDESPDSE